MSIQNQIQERDTYDVLSEGEGGSPKDDIVREVAWNLYCTAVPMRTGGRGRRGFMRSEKFADVIYGWHPETREETVGRHLSVDLNHL